MKTKPIAVLAACAFFLASCGKSPTTQTVNGNGSQPTPAPIQAEAFHGQVYKSFDQRKVLTLISKDECELNENGTILLCKYTKPNDTLRVVTTALGTSEVIYYRFTNQGLQDKDGHVLFSPEGLLEAQRQVELAKRAQQEAQAAAERQEAEKLRVAAIAAQREAEEQRLADERARKEAPEKLRALLTTHPALDGTYSTGFGPTKLTLRVISFDSDTGSVSAEVDFPEAGYDGAHSDHAVGNVSGDTLNLTATWISTNFIGDVHTLSRQWKLRFDGLSRRLVGQWVKDRREAFPTDEVLVLFNLK